jgi:putative membrane protein
VHIAALVAVALNALIHLYIVALEMFLWSRATRVFAIPRDQRENPLLKTMLKNQGLYNGFLVAGLVWGLVYPDPVVGQQIQLFFLGCIAVAGLYGAVTASPRILLVQTVPASIAAALVLLAA